MRVAEISRSPTNRALLLSAMLAATLLLLGLQIERFRILRVICATAFQLTDIVVQPVETLLPEAAIVLDPSGNIPERSSLQATRPPLRLAAASDQPGALQHLQMFGDRRHTHLKWRGQLGNRSLAQRQPPQNCAPG